MFSSWKAEIKNIELQCTKEEQKNLLEYVKKASVAVKDEKKAKGWYAHVMRYYVLCAAGEPLDDSYNANTIVHTKQTH